MRFLFNLASACLALCLASTAAADPPLFVYSTIDALLAGAYDGDLTVGELGKRGNFGLGTFNRLDGEMVLLNGVFHHVRADGSVVVASPSTKVPLAYVLPFTTAGGFTLDEASPAKTLAELEGVIDALLVSKNLFVAAKVAGRFAAISTRAIAPQVRPYRPLAEVAKEQVVFKREAVDGTLVGIRSPAFSKGFSVPGWHWHFISDEKSFGGHVLSATLVAGSVVVSPVGDVTIRLPRTTDFADADQSKDRSRELHQVESDKP